MDKFKDFKPDFKTFEPTDFPLYGEPSFGKKKLKKKCCEKYKKGKRCKRCPRFDLRFGSDPQNFSSDCSL